ncbi:MAG: Crp/Fnr family transcriptional regulator [Bauldia sp.]
MSLDSDIALLRGIPLFSELPTEQLRLLAFSAVRLELVADQVLFREGTKAASGFVVSSGGLQLTVGAEPDKHVVATCEIGSLIGEMALFVETKRPATATAAAASQVLEIERKVILRMLNEYPHLALRMRATLAERLNLTVTELARVRQVLVNLDRHPARRS